MLGKGNLVKTNILFFPLYILRKNIRFGLGWLPLPPSFFMKSMDFRFLVMLKLVILALEMTVRKF